MNFDHETLQVDHETLKNLQITTPNKASLARLSISSDRSSHSLSISDSPVPLSDSALKSKPHLQHLAAVASDAHSFSSPDPLSSCSAPGTDDDIDDVDELEPFSDSNLTSPKLAQNIERFLREHSSDLSQMASSHSKTHQRDASRRYQRKLRRGRSQTGSAGLILLPSESSNSNSNRSKSKSKGRKKSKSPRHILESESDDNDTDEANAPIDIEPKTEMPSTAPAMHLRSFSESALHRDIQTTQWPSTDESDGDGDGEHCQNALYRRFLGLKKKYAAQRRISKQFQDAITVIQDDNEIELEDREEHIKERVRAQYEITMMRMEQQKLTSKLHIENQLQSMKRQNSELAQQNKHLQSQVAQQTQIIGTMQQSMQAQQMSMVRRHSTAMSLGMGTDEEYTPRGMGAHCGTPMSEGQSFGFGDVRTPRTPRTPRDVTGVSVDMEMSPKYRKVKKRERRAMSEQEIEARLLKHDKEVQRVTGDGLSAWDRFLDLMTPAFCSCAPANTTKVSHKTV